MYALKPVFDLDAKVELPTCMYSLPVIQVSKTINAGSTGGGSDIPSSVLKSLEERQEAILAKLGHLSEEVKRYRSSIGLKDSSSASPAKKVSDLVIRCSPSNPAFSVPAIVSILAQKMKVYCSLHCHSCVSSLPPHLANFLPEPQVERKHADVKITLIWKDVGRQCELMVSPVAQSVIKGEVNILRYFARLFPSSFLYESDPRAGAMDNLLDSVTSLLWAPPKDRQPLLRALAVNLGKSSHLLGEEMSIADLALFSALKQLGLEKDLQPELKKWFTVISTKLMGGKGRRSSRRSSSRKSFTKRRNSERKSTDKSSEKKAPAGKKEKPAKKNNSPASDSSSAKTSIKAEAVCKDERKTPRVVDHKSKTKECATKSGDGKPPPPPPKSAREHEQVSLRESLYKATSKIKKRSMENTPKQAASPAEAPVPVTILKRESAPKLDNNNEIDARKAEELRKLTEAPDEKVKPKKKKPKKKAVKEFNPSGPVTILKRETNLSNKVQDVTVEPPTEQVSLSENSAAQKSKKNKAKKKKKNTDVPLDRDAQNAPGSLLTKQWPEIPHVFQSAEFTNLLTQTALVSEKLDGSNVAVSSRGFVASRRNILLNRPDPAELAKFKFSGQKLVNTFSLVESLHSVKDKFDRLFLAISVAEVIVYGELIQKGTATSKEDKYGYRERGFNAGDLYAFGCAIIFEEDLDKEQMLIASKHLSNNGFNPAIQTDQHTNRQYIVLLLNPCLKDLLAESGIQNFVKQTPLTLDRVVEEYTSKLVNNELEGVVLVFNGGQIFKWKGVEENYPDIFLQQISDLFKVLRFTRPSGLGVVEKMLEVATAARRIRAAANLAKEEKLLTQQLEAAYKSAVSKYSRLEDDLSQGSESRNTIVTRHLSRISLEMEKDANKNTAFFQQINTYAKSKIEEELKRIESEKVSDPSIIVV